MPLDADEVMPTLWIGSAPPTGIAIGRAGFHSLLLCARQYQPKASMFPGVDVVHAPFDDDPTRKLTDSECQLVHVASTVAAKKAMSGQKVLVTCVAGIDRSGLVTSLALWKITGLGGRKVLKLMRAARPHVLTQNPYMLRMVERLPGK